MQSNSIRISGLCCSYEEKKVLEDVRLNIGKGSFIAIAGPNGVGKSTLLKYLFKQLRAENDKVHLYDIDINSLKQKEIARLISFQGQSERRNDDFTVREVVQMGRFAYSDMNRSENLVDQALEAVGIKDLENKLITRISGGEFQLVMLSRTICQNSSIMALDEPANNLDPRHQKMMLELLKKQAESKKTVLCVMHDLNSILQYCDKTILLYDKGVFAYGKTEQVLTTENIKKVYGIDCTIVEVEGRKVLLF